MRLKLAKECIGVQIFPPIENLSFQEFAMLFTGSL